MDSVEILGKHCFVYVVATGKRFFRNNNNLFRNNYLLQACASGEALFANALQIIR